jgi:hypothetical protein
MSSSLSRPGSPQHLALGWRPQQRPHADRTGLCDPTQKRTSRDCEHESGPGSPMSHRCMLSLSQNCASRPCREFAAFRRGTFDGPTAVWPSAGVLRRSRSANGPDLTSITQQARSCHHNPPVVSMSRWPIQLTPGSSARGIAQNGRRSRASPAQRPVPDTGDRRSPRRKRLVQRLIRG